MKEGVESQVRERERGEEERRRGNVVSCRDGEVKPTK